jgi:acetyltransferase-like isoleucine patch superfamily enzyme
MDRSFRPVNRFNSVLNIVYHGLRFVLRPISVHYTCMISRRAEISIINGGSVSIGPRTRIHQSAMLLTYKGDIRIGANCSVNPYAILYGEGGLIIGDGVRIAAHTVIIPSNHNFKDPDVPIFRQGHTQKGVVIGDDVWIGTHCTILDGVTVGNGCVIGAGSVVTKSIPEYSVVAGVPARVLYNRKQGRQAPDPAKEHQGL